MNIITMCINSCVHNYVKCFYIWYIIIIFIFKNIHQCEKVVCIKYLYKKILICCFVNFKKEYSAEPEFIDTNPSPKKVRLTYFVLYYIKFTMLFLHCATYHCFLLHFYINCVLKCKLILLYAILCSKYYRIKYI
jgi:hypothetical protein